MLSISRLLVVSTVVGLAVLFGLVFLGWGDITDFFAHPARSGLVISTLLLAIVSLFSEANLSSGKREDVSNRWIFIPFMVLSIVFAYVPPYMDRRDLFTLDGDALRYFGLALYIIGGSLRVWAILVLGKRFSGLVAIQEDHQLMTNGVYTFIRHPSYLGLIVAMIGWTLIFRSVLVFIVIPIWIATLIARIQSEENLLQSEFGQEYTDYQQHTWRLIPFVY
ncbi:isoprenylcysteine carboxylmethyltransferase family protein [Aetokthonos hydrillicola Thurmond2011]|jgi:protein-S-isoprenylcysteine O-methyltransferase Ste14|uniref:Isoprenylcysteine carboxylmethyltransferase family protein n=1 Tax=Aetokthonos hydrillicola Thurmond2011 TaxID=2712845 RepID=A0AAP5MDK1_9CYAN|nr:isoprenylcysteine carboxylmethyltransferase family protein [Aetokthonos hydrillicola]MBO3459932.1 isoprenylcysteine carboxylmethyltransferase family protein [Aetokthonos hydrillicola CCALA 1050]MBW4584050.1 isoprenylcysteine carboxylmethyltransferase family protein [Aetokthonos hydrillicola CCALA 1050]MDR9900692.1 isoprenylcysteine carboxylmethyltransferase family protein [Aetokthonos hydrillicola Thurmond2011]